MAWQFFIKFSNIKFHENLSNKFQSYLMQEDGKT
jgi:hypothetical protein